VNVNSGLTFGVNAATLGALAGTGNVALLNGTNPMALSIGGNNSSTTYSGILSGSGNLTKAGTGTLILANANSYTGTTTVSNGTLLVNGSTVATSAVTVAAGATLGGTGSVQGSIAINGGILAPGAGGPGILATGNLAFASGSRYYVDLNSSTVGSGYDQANVTGTVGLGGAQLIAYGTRAGHAGDVLVIIKNDGNDPVTNTFLNQLEGFSVVINGVTYTITYLYNAEQGTAGNGNDVALIDNTPSTLPDLIVTGLSATAVPAIQPGAAVTISWQDSNTGSGATSGDWYDWVSVVNTTTGVTLVDAEIPPTGDGSLDPGQSRPRSITFNLPAGQQGIGHLQVTVTADWSDQVVESNETNNTSVTTVTSMSGPTADHTTVTANEGSLATNSGSFSGVGTDTMTITTSVGTVTQDNVTKTWNWFYTSPDGPQNSQTVTITATASGGGASTTTFALVVQNVAPSAVSVSATPAVIDENGTTTFIGTFADPGILDTHTVTIDWGDGPTPTVLNLGAGVTVIPATPHRYLDNPATGTSYAISVTVTDKDGGSATGGTSVVVNNVSPTITADHPTVTVTQGTSATNTGTFSDVPADTVIITTSVGIVTQDNLGKTWSWSYTPTHGPQDSQTVTITATDDDGATSTATFALVVQGSPDLQVVGLSATGDPSLQSGALVIVAWQDSNTGNVATSNGWYDHVTVVNTSTSETLLDTEVPYNPAIDGGPIVPGDLRSRSTTFRLPDGPRGVGNLQVMVTTDSLNQVAEYNASGTGESNNTTQATATSVLAPYPNLQVTTIGLDPNPAYSGKPLQVSWTVGNAGNLAATGTWTDRVYLSTDDQLDAGDMSLGEAQHAGTLLATASYPASFTATLPNGISGQYYILVKTDADNTVLEAAPGGEGDNVRSQALTIILTQPPDLQVTSVSAPLEGWSSRGIDVAWRVTNNGTGPTASTWIDKVYLSDDNQPGNDVLLGELTRPNDLAVGQSYVRRQTFTLPDGISGNRWIVVVTDADNTLYEGGGPGESNNTRVSAAFLVHRTPYADLQVASVTVPSSATAGDQAAFSWTVTNTGDGATDASAWTDCVYLSTDRVFDGSDLFLGTVQNPSYLAAGESYAQSLTATIPTNVTGQRYVIVVTDNNNAQYEYNDQGTGESNNTRASDTTVTIAAAPSPGYLHVKQITISPTPPNTVFAGQPITVSWTIENTGTTDVTGNWDHGLVLSPTPDWNGSNGYRLDFHVGQETGPLLPGQTYSRQIVVSLPDNISGTWYVVVRPDEPFWAHVGNGQDAPRDNGSAPVQIQLPPSADLQVTSVDAPATGIAGQQIAVSWTVSNEGFGPTTTSSWTDAVYLSTDTILVTSGAGADTLVGSFSHAGSLAAVEHYTQTQSVTLPYGTSGPYYVFVLTDSGNTVFEHADGYDAEANNSNYDHTPMQVTITPPPDLQVTAITPAASAASGQTLSVTWTVTNTGSGATGAGPWTDALVLSADDSLATTDDNVLLGRYDHSGSLAAGNQYTTTKTVTLPERISGTYHLFVTTDVDNKVYEANEVNNSLAVALPVALSPSADLSMGGLAVTGVPSSGQPITVDWTVTNVGPVATRPDETSWTDAVYLSVDGIWDPQSDTKLDSFVHNGSLAAGASYSQSRDITLPVGLSGNYTLFVVTDTQDTVIEPVGGASNVASMSISIALTPPPDLQVASLTVPGAAYSGQPVTIQWTVQNLGAGDTAVGAWYDSVYLSKDQYLDPTADIPLGSVQHSGVLNASGQYTANLTANIPANASGPYYVFVATDSTGLVFESNENNNSRYNPTAMLVSLPPPADLLVVDSITVPVMGIAGAAPATPITWRVTNQGTAAAMGTWFDAIYLSADTTWDISDALVPQFI
jgi:autotransporter-associated beta strand protein